MGFGYNNVDLSDFNVVLFNVAVYYIVIWLRQLSCSQWSYSSDLVSFPTQIQRNASRVCKHSNKHMFNFKRATHKKLHTTITTEIEQILTRSATQKQKSLNKRDKEGGRYWVSGACHGGGGRRWHATSTQSLPSHAPTSFTSPPTVTQ